MDQMNAFFEFLILRQKAVGGVYGEVADAINVIERLKKSRMPGPILVDARSQGHTGDDLSIPALQRSAASTTGAKTVALMGQPYKYGAEAHVAAGWVRPGSDVEGIGGDGEGVAS